MILIVKMFYLFLRAVSFLLVRAVRGVFKLRVGFRWPTKIHLELAANRPVLQNAPETALTFPLGVGWMRAGIGKAE